MREEDALGPVAGGSSGRRWLDRPTTRRAFVGACILAPTLTSLALIAGPGEESVRAAAAPATGGGSHWADHWGLQAVNGAEAVFSEDTSTAHSGQASLKVTDGSALTPNVFGTVWQTFPTKPNTTYEFHAWIKSAATRSTVFTVTSDWVEQTKAPDGVYDWTEVSFQHTTTATETSLTFRLIVQDITTAFWLDDVSAMEQGTSQNLLQNGGFEPGSADVALSQRFAALEAKLPALQSLITQVRGRNIAVDYPTVDYATIVRILPVGRNDVAGGQGARADYIAGVLEQLYAHAMGELQGYSSGASTAPLAPRYVTGRDPLQVRGRSFIGDTQVLGQAVKRDQTVFLTGYGHFSKAEIDIPRFRDLGTNAVQFEIGPNSTIFPASMPGWQPVSAGALRTTFNRVIDTAHTGNGSLRIGNLADTAGGASGTLTQTFTARPSTAHTFSMWVKGNNAGEVVVSAGANGPGQVIMPTGTYDWQRVTFPYTTSDAENTLTLTIQARSVTGTTWIDDVAATPNGSDANAIDNGGFERIAPRGALFAVDDTLARTRVVADLQAAERSNVAVNLLLSPHYMPQFVYDQTPDLHIPYAGFLSYDVNNPVAKQVVAAHIGSVMALVKRHPSLQSVTLTNEPIYVNSTTSTYTQQLWHAYLQRIYPTVSAMNGTWGTTYSSFDAVPPSDGTHQATPYFYDWVQFNDQMFADWHAWMGQEVHAADPAVPVQAKIMWGPFRGSDLSWGVDVEQFDNFSQINGDDNYGILPWGEDGYAQENEFYDLQSSMKGAPVFNSEDHIVLDFDTDYEPLQAANARMTLWQGALHGRSGSTIWVWDEAFNSMLVRPDVVDQVGRTGLDLNRLANEVTAFQNSRPSVGILYSVASKVYAPGNGYVDATNSAYKALLYDGVKPGFVSEEQAANGGLDEFKVLVLPRTTNVHAPTLAAIQRFEQSGGRVVVIGNDALTADEHNQPLDSAIRQAVLGGAAELLDASVAFDTLRGTLLTDLQHWGLQDVTVIDAASGQPVTGVEYETTTYEGRLLMNICSYTAGSTKRVYIQVDGKRITTPQVDLISGKHLTTGPLTLDPITPVLLQLQRS